MQINRLAELIEKYSPAHFRDICVALSSLSDELEYTKAALSNELMNAQKHDDFSQAREIIDMQEELSQKITLIQAMLPNMGTEDMIPNQDQEESEDMSGTCLERTDYSLYDMDDTVAYNIKDTDVTFKRPAAFSFRGKKYPVTKWKALLAKLCDILYKEDPTIINRMAREPRQPGKKRVKMSVNKADIHSPVKIAESNIWLETNRSASDIRDSILILLGNYGISDNMLKVYFRRDYAALHAEDDQSE